MSVCGQIVISELQRTKIVEGGEAPALIAHCSDDIT